MDRTAWIIIGICAALLGLNIYMGNNKKAETAPIPAPQTAAAAANAPVTGGLPGAGTSAPEQPSVNKALEEDKTAPITLVATQEVNGRQEPFITYKFNRIGGSIGTVTLHNDIVDSQKVADHNITINEAQQRGIGELVFNMDATQDPSYDNTVYKEVKRTADSVTLEGYDPARQLFISKTYTLHPVKNLEGEVLPGSKYLIRLTVSLLNKSSNVQDLRYMGIFGGSAYPIAKRCPCSADPWASSAGAPTPSPKANPKIPTPISFTTRTAPWNRKRLPISRAAFSAAPRPASWKAPFRT